MVVVVGGYFWLGECIVLGSLHDKEKRPLTLGKDLDQDPGTAYIAAWERQESVEDAQRLFTTPLN